MQWLRFEDLAQSTGLIFLIVVALWSMLVGLFYWAFARGAGSMGEDVKYKMVEDDRPVTRTGEEGR